MFTDWSDETKQRMPSSGNNWTGIIPLTPPEPMAQGLCESWTLWTLYTPGLHVYYNVLGKLNHAAEWEQQTTSQLSQYVYNCDVSWPHMDTHGPKFSDR